MHIGMSRLIFIVGKSLIIGVLRLIKLLSKHRRTLTNHIKLLASDPLLNRLQFTVLWLPSYITVKADSLWTKFSTRLTL